MFDQVNLYRYPTALHSLHFLNCFFPLSIFSMCSVSTHNSEGNMILSSLSSRILIRAHAVRLRGVNDLVKHGR